MATSIVNQTTTDASIGELKNIPVGDQIIIEEIQSDETEHLITEKTTEEIVKEYFIDTPVMADIAYCESRYRQFDKYGNALRGKVNRADVGVMQINEKYHAGTAAKLGIDIHTLEGNLAYAEYLYNKKGTAPWVHSSDCWNTVREIALNN